MIGTIFHDLYNAFSGRIIISFGTSEMLDINLAAELNGGLTKEV